ncbi:uncharacterized protein LOC111354573 [Spodoptera litura]|uniref:Uncharacterized protein LOC111354573 n=1 Tax=Spodoptera litura TaxID=69820 RepID=A0A9J7E8S4_SPOLT|nr:uncharacterized protein LOC111354573 [Spodoptera litura]
MPTIKKMKKECITKTAELIKVGYDVGQFVEIYSVCFDPHKNMPLRTIQKITTIDDEPRLLAPSNDWLVHPGIGNVNINRGFTCQHDNETCCYEKTYMANPRYFIHGLAKKAAFIDFLNVVPSWRNCANSSQEATWEDVDRILENVISGNSIYVWTGAHTFEDINGVSIPRYLYKVVKSEAEEFDPMAIIRVNSPTPTEKDILCTTIDLESLVIYDSSPVLTKYTYACDFLDFLVELDLEKEDFEI